MTVEHLQSTMSNAEFVRWQAFYVYRKAMTELNDG
jgi:hypothetical protein